MMVELYSIALDGLQLEALENVVMKIVKGTWPEQFRFAPRPPEMAAIVREEARRIRELREPMNKTPARKPPLIEQLMTKTAGRRVLAENVSIMDARNGSWPVGATYVAGLGTMFAPEKTESVKKSRAREIVEAARSARA